MQEISENILNDIRNCATVNSLEAYRRIINTKISNNDLKMSYIGAIGARYFDIFYFERITEIYYPEFRLN